MIIQADLPGVKESELQLKMESPGVLKLVGQRTTRKEDKSDMYTHIEISTGRFERSFRVPHTLKTSDIKAHLENGVLTIQVPKLSDPTSVIKIEEHKK
jgi:HSP20 family protein